MATVEATKVEAQIRDSRGKNEARRTRRSGSVPGVLYGAKKEALAISVDPKQISRILRSESGHNTIFDLAVGGEQTKAMIVDLQFEPVRGAVLHLDLKRIAMDEKIRVRIPIHLTGEAEGVKTQGGILDQVLREVEIECLPADIPPHISVDVSDLVFGKVLRVADLPHGGKLDFITDENQTVAHITTVKEEEVAAPAAEGVVGAEAAAPAEPEVIKKGKQETGEEGEAAAEAAPAPKAEKKEKK
jgi:large subunit ribosomal protein L25